MKTLLLTCVAVALSAGLSLHAQEVLTLDTPESQGQPDRTTWKIIETHFIFEAGALSDTNQIRIVLLDNNGSGFRCQYGGDNTSTAHADLVQLNKLDLSSNSLTRRIMNSLLTKGGTDPLDPDGGACLPAGMVTGTPQ